MTASPTQRSLKYYRDQGYVVQVVERWNQYAGIRQDLFNFIDLVAIKPGVILGIQATSYGHISDRKKKILESPLAIKWLEAGGRIEVVGWRKVGNWWEAKVVEINEALFNL